MSEKINPEGFCGSWTVMGTGAIREDNTFSTFNAIVKAADEHMAKAAVLEQISRNGFNEYVRLVAKPITNAAKTDILKHLLTEEDVVQIEEKREAARRSVWREALTVAEGIVMGPETDKEKLAKIKLLLDGFQEPK